MINRDFVFVSVFNKISIMLILLAGITMLPAQQFHRDYITQEVPMPSILPADSLQKTGFRDAWLSRDKGLHAAGSLILTAAVFNMHHKFGDARRKDAVLTGIQREED
jgi:hypothetical protein